MERTNYVFLTAALALGLFAAMVICMEIGRRLALALYERRGPAARSAVGVVDGAVYAVMGLLLGFTFSGAANRFDQRRATMVREIIAVSTAWDRIDLLPVESQAGIRVGLRRYVDALLAAYAGTPATEPERRAREEAAAARQSLWQGAVVSSLTPDGEKARMLLLPALNEMFNAVDTETLSQRIHTPIAIYAMLTLTALASAVLAGYGVASGPLRSWIHIVAVAATVALCVYIILELEAPRLGSIRVDVIDRALVELRATMD